MGINKDKAQAVLKMLAELLLGENDPIAVDVSPQAPEKKKRGRPKKVVALPPPPAIIESEPEPEEPERPVRRRKITENVTNFNKTGRKQARAASLYIGPRPNQFIDNKTEARKDLKEVNPQLKKLYANTGHREPRPETEYFEVECVLCGKIEEVVETLSRENYKCNACCVGA